MHVGGPDTSSLASSRPQWCIAGETEGSWKKNCAEPGGQNCLRAIMSPQGLSYLHAISRDQTVMAEYYVEKVLNKTAASAMKRKRQNWPPKQVKLPEDV